MSKYKTVKGFNDIYSSEYRIGKYIKDIIIEIGESYNYKPIELAPFEYSDLYLDYFGKEKKDELFAIDNRYSCSITLRYNLVFPILRSIIENKLYVDNSLPIKFMTNASNYKFNKKDRNQKASNERFAFVNANCNNYHLDIESINLALDIFYALGMEEVELKIYKNKLETKEFKEIKKALDDFNIEYTVSKNNLESIYDGLQYEFIYNKTLVAKGGRHNYLVKSLQAPEIPSSSLEFDIDEIKNIIEFTSLTPPLEEELDFLIVTVDSDYDMSLKVASRLRELGVKVDIMYNEYNLNRLRDFIDRLNIPYTIIISHNDAIKGIVRVRNSISKEEGDVYFEDFMEQLIDESKHHHDE